jgi:hypothetical protein
MPFGRLSILFLLFVVVCLLDYDDGSYGGARLLLVHAFSQPYTTPSAKHTFLDCLDDPIGFNKATRDRTELIKEMTVQNPTPQPGSVTSFTPFAVGKWRIVYAPHISAMGSLVGGSFDPVVYILRQDGTMTSHARYKFPLVGSGWLSVSGTYGSADNNRVCQVDFDRAWVTLDSDDRVDSDPTDSFEEVPESISKTVIQKIGQLGFVKSVSVFPVSYLDSDTIVFDFELLGTRICARKVGT